ncbi:enoyl-CoA hydratase/isomerase family protein [Paraburkholderia sp. LEh10]|uniref:enoyl-CoA hydratase/isomerase family protein n=1 Tax=Paraburkholderia sp. LEh10 TaxID=2821353 RepID=UPI001AE87F62|nr:enoyl-CoA hydratase/isomerase family protein [Paraburkholderia sp. LEh10]MBP0589562.1 enoyl-CoA hydratase/isomerase family protein [Paraburkholderia sp. LEh10]
MIKLVHHVKRISPELDVGRIDINQSELRADIILDHPLFNLVSGMQWEQLRAAFEVLDDDPRVRVIVVRAQGEHFSSASDIDDATGASPEHIARFIWNIEAPARCSKPVIAANRGYCFGAGFGLSLACDFRIATETTIYALSSQNADQVPGADALARLQKLVGAGRAKEIVMRSRQIRGAQAYEWGIATEFVVDSDLEMLTDSLVRELVAVPQDAQRKAKRLLNAIEDIPLPALTEAVERGHPLYLNEAANTRRAAFMDGK